MDFSNLKALTIPEGEVAEIICNGVTLWKSGGLPSEYQRVEYIYTDLTGAYINLGFAFDTACTFYIDCENETFTDYLFGAAENSGKLRCMITQSNAQYTIYGSTVTGYIAMAVPVSGNEKKIKVEMRKGAMTATNLVDGATNTHTGQTEFVMTNNLYLLAQNYNGNFRGARSNTLLKSFSYYDKTDTLICDLVPCYRKADGEVGMYDLVRGVFLTNAGSNRFLKGADVN